MAAISTVFTKLRLDTSSVKPDAERGLREARFEQLGNQQGRKFGDGLNVGAQGGLANLVTSMNRTLGAVLTSVPAFAVFTGGATAATAAAVRFGAAVAPAAQSAALLPAVGFAAAAGVGAMKIALMGVSDALEAGLAGETEKYAEATKGLSRNTRDAVGAVVAFRPQLLALRNEVSSDFFAGMRTDIRALFTAELPVLRARLSDISGGLGQAAQRALEFGAQKQTVTDVGASLGNVSTAAGGIAPAVQPALSIVRDLVTVGSQFLPGMAAGFGDVTARAAAFVSQARQTGQLAEFIQTGIDTLDRLGGIFSSIGGIASSVFQAMTTGGGDVLGALGQVLRVVNEILASTEGQRALVTIFQSLSTISAALGPALAQVLVAVLPLVPSLAELAATVGVALAGAIVELAPLIADIAQKLADWAHELSQNKELFDGLVSVVGGAAGFLEDHQEIIAGIALAYVGYRAALIGYAAGQAIATGAAHASAAAHAIHNAAVALSMSTVGTFIGVKAIEAAAWIRSTATTVADTVARGVNTAALFVATGGIQVWLGAKAAELAAWIRSTASTTAATAATVGHTVAMGAARAATVVWTGVQWLLNAALTANPIGLVVVAIGLLVGAIVLAWNRSETFRNVVLGVWRALRQGIGEVWDWLRGVFSDLSRWVTETLPNAFRRGVDGIQNAWNRVREAAREPVSFVVNQVINRLIGGFNRVSKVFGGPQVAEIGGFAGGGRIPGAPSSVDNRIARGPGGNALAVATGEFLVNARQTSRWLPVLEAINAGRFPSPSATASAYRDSYATGGLVGGILDFGRDVLDAITDPIKFLKKPVEAMLSRIPGATQLRDVLAGMGKRLADAAVSKVKGLFSAGGGGRLGSWPPSPAAQRGDSGVWRAIVALIRGTGPVSGAFGNAYRHGDPLWHGSGRAVDWMGFNQDALATFFMARRNQVLELIHRTNRRDYAVTRGRDMGSFSAGLMEAHRNHIHIAMAGGGLIPARVFDQGGAWPSGTLGYNGSGRTEQVTSAPTMDAVIAELRLLRAEVERIAPGVGREINGVGRSMVQMARAH